MGRGSADFSGEALRELRQTRRVEGRLLSAAALAKGTADLEEPHPGLRERNLRPDPQRVADIADLFGVPPKALRPHATGTSIRRLRCDAGLTIAEAARRLSISRSGYTNIEHSALLPARDDGSVRNALPDVFGTSPRVVDRALRTHPAARRRQDELADHLGETWPGPHDAHPRRRRCRRPPPAGHRPAAPAVPRRVLPARQRRTRLLPRASARTSGPQGRHGLRPERAGRGRPGPARSRSRAASRRHRRSRSI